MRQGEDDVEVGNGQQFGLRCSSHCRVRATGILDSADSTRVVRDALVSAGIALFDVPTERRGAAALDVAHDTALPTAERVSVVLPVGRPDRRKMSATSRPVRSHRPAQKMGGLAGRVQRLEVGNRSNGLVVAHGAGRDLQVSRGGGQAAMTHQQLDPAHVGAGLEQVRGERMTQRMRGDGLRSTGAAAGVLACQRHCDSGDGPGMSPGNSQYWGRDHSSTGAGSPAAAARASRIGRGALTCSTRSTMRWLSMSVTFSWVASEMRRPAA